METTSRNDPIFLTEAELARRWRVTVRTLYNYREKGQTPKPMKTPGGYRYRLDDVIAYENKMIEANS